MQPRPYIGCDLAATTPIFLKMQISYISLVLIKYNKQVEMSQLPYSSEYLIIAIQNTLEARSMHFEKQGNCNNF